ncbi:MerR family transcriptional regulator [Saccharothrix sp. AJ9571]|nr:MerR family transcriptional regulator [Saccharothrix sp. AJ9571]
MSATQRTPAPTSLSIGELSERTGVPTSALRYYDELGLVRPMTREAGRRRYAASAVREVSAVLFFRDIGFSLAEIGHFLAGERQGPTGTGRAQAGRTGRVSTPYRSGPHRTRTRPAMPSRRSPEMLPILVDHRRATARPLTGRKSRTSDKVNMGYCLQAVIASEPVLRDLAGDIEEACIVPLCQHLWLLPMTDAFFDAVTVLDAPEIDGFRETPAGFGSALAACSAKGPVAYVEAEFFGGDGTQVAQVWNDGEVVLGPLHLAEDEPFPSIGSPISRALRQLEVAKGEHLDEFDAVGLGRHRDTEDWLPATD